MVAVLLAVLALWVRFGLQQRLRGHGAGHGAGGRRAMGLAIAGMHYTGMAALRFVEPIERLQARPFSVPVQTAVAGGRRGHGGAEPGGHRRQCGPALP